MKKPERRLHPRLREPDLIATVVFEAGVTITCAIEDLSYAGARIVASYTPAIGERVQLVLSHGSSTRTVSMVGGVVRVAPFGGDSKWSAVALRFPTLSDAARELIADLTRQMQAPQRARTRATVLVVEDEHVVRAELERDLDQLGFAVHLAATPLDVVRVLDDPARKIQIALVDLGLGPANGLDVLGYLADEHRNVRRVVMSRRRGDELDREVEAGRAHGALRKPWTAETLESAVSGTVRRTS